jgi:hypothetical protein
MTSGYSSDSTDNAIQANIVAAGYGSTVVAITHEKGIHIPSVDRFTVQCNPSQGRINIDYTLLTGKHLTLDIVDQQGRWVSLVTDDIIASGKHKAVWDIRRVPAGVYILRMAIDDRLVWTGKVVKVGGL